MNDLRVSLVQASTVWHDADANRALYGDLARSLAGTTDLIVLPETFTSGFSNEAIGRAETMRDASVAWLGALADEVGAVVTGSMVIREGERVFNRLLWAQPDGRVAHYDKRHLFRMAGEHKHFAAGEEQLLLELNGWRIRPLICYDLRFPLWSRDPHHTDLLLYTANWPAARRQHWNRLLPARAIENLCYVAAVNRIGTDGKGHPYSGDSQVLDFQGDALLEAGDADGVFRATLRAGELAAYRKRFPAYLDADDFVLT
jgi:omega-amidase